jgi:hypothetical protein
LRFRIPRARERRVGDGDRAEHGRGPNKETSRPFAHSAVVAEDTPTTHRTQLPSSYYETTTDLLRPSQIGSSSTTTTDHFVIITLREDDQYR